MKIVIPGGSGQVGSMLARAYNADGHEVVILSRNPQSAPWKVTKWDGATMGDWCREIEGSDVVINLAGRSVDCRYNAANLSDMMNSRVRSTQIVGEAIGQAEAAPKIWIQASTATIYAHRFDNANDEETGIIGGSEAGVPRHWKFSIDIAQAWERAVAESDTPRTKKVIIRSAMIMGTGSGGIFDTLLRLVRFGLGGRWGDGRQYVSWIHETDFVSAVHWLIVRNASGVYNLASPAPLPNGDFTRILRKCWGIRLGVPSPAWLLELGAVFLRTETELMLKSRRVVPKRLLDEGFKFLYPVWPEAAAELCTSWRSGPR